MLSTHPLPTPTTHPLPSPQRASWDLGAGWRGAYNNFYEMHSILHFFNQKWEREFPSENLNPHLIAISPLLVEWMLFLWILSMRKIPLSEIFYLFEDHRWGNTSYCDIEFDMPFVSILFCVHCSQASSFLSKPRILWSVSSFLISMFFSTRWGRLC